jgi:hypothetical protein
VPGFGHAPRDVRDRALLLLGFAGAFRASDLVGLNIPDITFTDASVKSHDAAARVITIAGMRTVQSCAGSRPDGSHCNPGLDRCEGSPARNTWHPPAESSDPADGESGATAVAPLTYP